ncbi:hypothetical protein [Streptomyces sp. NPDC051554]|uniref:hypothetical protein n=1 Tax=Streptomyces sp. NPDC051554 TaxID=3365656 RepID=UPI0037AA711D
MMLAMSDQWPIILTAALGLTSTFGLAFLQHRENRGQSVGQASIEHGQWLRGRRQEAYTALFPAWDAAVKDLRAFQYRWEETLEHQAEVGEGFLPWYLVEKKADEVLAALRPHIELCELLGPQGVNEAAEGLYEAFRRLRQVMEEQAQREPSVVVWETWEAELGRAAIARHNFQLACIWGLRRTPSAEVEEPYG